MQPSDRWPRFEEPFRRTLARNVTLAAIAGVVLALRSHDLGRLLPGAALALWPTLGGHYVELAFLNGLRPRIPPGRLTQALVRVLAWSIGGALLYVCMAATAFVLPVRALPLSLWWYGPCLFIGIELVVHAVMAMRGLPNFYNGRG